LMRKLTLHHSTSIRLLGCDACPDFEVEPLLLSVDRLDDEVAVEGADKRDVHVKGAARQREDPIDRFVRSVQREPRELGETFETGRALCRNDAAHLRRPYFVSAM